MDINKHQERRSFSDHSIKVVKDFVGELAEDGNAFATSQETYSVKQKPLKLWALVVLIFFGVSGGPYGIEGTVKFGVYLSEAFFS